MRLVIRTPWSDVALLATRALIACSGCCLTLLLVACASFAVDVSAETLSKTTFGAWRKGTRLELERSVAVTSLGTTSAGDGVNSAVETIGRHAARLSEAR